MKEVVVTKRYIGIKKDILNGRSWFYIAKEDFLADGTRKITPLTGYHSTPDELKKRIVKHK